MKTEQVFKILTVIAVSCQAVATNKEENSFASKPEEIVERIQNTPGESALKMWPKGKVRYKLGPHFDVNHIIFIIRAMKEIESVSCVRFHPVSYSTKAFIKIRNNLKTCTTTVGHNGSEQNFNLINDPISFNYQHKAANRNQYIRIEWKNIQEGKQRFFKMLDSEMMPDFGVDYDYESIMHIDRKMFSKNGNDTIVPLKAGNIQLGEQISLSDGDIKKLNKMYKCN